MRLFELVPDKFFSILTSSKKEIYVEALFVVRQAFKTELVIRREDLIAMLLDSLESSILQADFTEETEEMCAENESVEGLSGKVHLLVRKLKDTGWLEVEYERNSFDENITIPDYAISIINLLYDLSSEQIKEYNSYVYATYAALKSTDENPDYLYQALQTAYGNTIKLVDELKLLFNNIKRYHQRISDSISINELLEEHFDRYREKIVDTIYYPLKTIDSVPRFKHAIISILNEWVLDDKVIENIALQGVGRHVFANIDMGKEEALYMINSIADTYESIEGMIADIDQKHVEYTNASIDRIRYMMNTDRSAKGKLVELLKNAGNKTVYEEMEKGIEVYKHAYIDRQSLYDRVKRNIRTEGKPLAIQETTYDNNVVDGFLNDVRKQYSTRKIDDFIEKCFEGKNDFTTEDIVVEDTEQFILFLLGTIRGREKSARYTIDFLEGNVDRQGYSLPLAAFRKKE